MGDPFKLRTPIFFFIFFIFMFILTALLSSERNIRPFLSPSLYRHLFSLSRSAPSPQLPVSKPDFGSGTDKRGNRTTIVPDSEEVSGRVGFESRPKGENGSRNVPDLEGDSGRLGFESGPKAEDGSRNVPDLEGDSGRLGFESGRGGGNGSRVVVSLQKNDENVGFVNGSGEVKGKKDCDLYMGKWVRDDGYPVYEPGSCPFVDEAFDCQTNGRPDSRYLNWRWKPDDCLLPRFNATDFLVRLRGKRLMLVGDSVNRNQFESMLCLLYQGLPDKSKMFEVHGYKITKGRGFYIFKFVDFNCTVEFVRSHFLVREGVRVNGEGHSNPTLSIDKIDKSAKRWKQADILIFNTGHWWTHGKTSRG